MFTLIIIPNFKGTVKETVGAIFTTILLDSTYIVPMVF